MIRKIQKKSYLDIHRDQQNRSTEKSDTLIFIQIKLYNIDGKKKEERKRKRYLDISIDRYRSDANDKGIKKTKDEVTERDDIAEGRARGSSVLK